MRAYTFSDVILRGRACSVGVLARVLNEHCSQACRLGRTMGFGSAELAQAVVDALPQALHVGLTERQPKGAATQSGPADTTQVQLSTTALLELVHLGLPGAALRLRADIQFQRLPSFASAFEPGNPTLQAWQADWTLALADHGAHGSVAQTFQSGRSHVHLSVRS